MPRMDQFLAGIDIGTTKVCTVIARHTDKGGVDVIGAGEASARGMRKGIVVDLDQTVDSIRQSVSAAEAAAGVDVERAWVGISGGHIKGFNSRGVVAVPQRNGRGVAREDVSRVLDAAKSLSLPRDREVLHVIPQEFMVDDQEGIADPTGMPGTRLEAKAHVVTCSAISAQNLVTCLNRAGVEVIELLLEQVAAAEAVLTHEERERGCILVDIGGGATGLALFRRGSVWNTSVLPTGGDHFTNDIAIGLRTSIPEAEKIKRRYGCVLASLVPVEEAIEVPTVGNRKPRLLKRHVLSEILHPRAEEILSLVRQEIDRIADRSEFPAGVILTGGGAELEGLVDVCESLFETTARKGSPTGFGGMADAVSGTASATAVGLVMYAKKHEGAARPAAVRPGRLTGKIRSWFAEMF